MIDNAVSEDALFAKLRGWVRAVHDIECIKDHPGAPRPEGPYVMLNAINARRMREMGAILYEEETGDEQVTERRATDWEWTWSVHCYAADAMDRCRLLVGSLEIGTIRVDHLYPLVFRRTSDVRRLPEMVQGGFEGRAQFDLVIAATVLDGFLVDVAETGVVTYREPLRNIEATLAYP